MKKKTLLLISLLVAANVARAEFGLLEGVAKQAAKDTVKAVAPEAVKEAESAKKTLQGAKALEGAVTSAPQALKQQAEQRVKAAAQQKMTETATSIAPNAVKEAEAAKQALDQANALKNKMTNAPQSLKKEAKDAAKAKVMEETSKGLDELLR